MSDIKQYKTVNSIVACIDVLGASQMIFNSEEESLNIIHDAYDQALYVMELVKPYDEERFLNVDVSIFSDNIVISMPINDNEYKAFVTIAVFSAMIQLQFLRKGVLARGGISSGGFFKDKVMLWGKALISAHQLEEKIAIYPRIIVEPSLIERLNFDSLSDDLLKQDEDGFYFLNYMRRGVIDDVALYEKQLKDSVDNIEILLRNCKGNLKATQKVNWHRKYLLSIQKTYYEK